MRTRLPLSCFMLLLSVAVVRPLCAHSGPGGGQGERPPLDGAAVRAALRYGIDARAGTPHAFHETPLPDTLLKGRPSDPWLAFDKIQHTAFSFLWTLGGQYALVNKAGWSEKNALPLSISLSAGVGLAKELYDWRRGARRYFSRRDLAADALGILLATGFILL